MNSFQDNRKISLIAFIITILFLFIFLFFFKDLIHYYCDDPGMISILKGGKEGISHPNAIFLSPLVSTILFKLYSVNAAIPWYFIFMYIAQGIAFFFCTRLVLKLFTDIYLRIVFEISFIFLCYPIFIAVNFTSVSLFLWFMITSDILISTIKKELTPFHALSSGFLISISILIRPSIVLIGFLFILPVILILLKNSFGWKKISIILVGIVPLLLISFFIGLSKPFNSEISQNYYHIQKCRSRVLDTNAIKPSENVTYSVFSTNDILSLQLWLTYDDSVFSKENLETFVKNHFHIFETINVKMGLENISSLLVYLIFFLFAFAVITLTGEGKANIKDKVYFPSKIKILLLLTFFYILCLNISLCFIRYPFRVKVPIICYLFSIFLLLSLILKNHTRKSVKPLTKILLVFIPIVFICFSFIQTTETDSRLNKINQYHGQIVTRFQFLSPDTKYLVRIPRMNFKQSVFSDNLWITRSTFPCGWNISTPYYYNYLASLSIKDGREFMLKLVDDSDFILMYWGNNHKNFPYVKSVLEDFYMEHYNKSVIVKLYRNFQYYINPNEYEGWIFFNVKSN